MRFYLNGPRYAGNHALANFLKHNGFKRYPRPALFLNGMAKFKYPGKQRSAPWGPFLAEVKDGEFACGHSRWSPDLSSFTVLQVRREPTEILVSCFRRWVRNGRVELEREQFVDVVRSGDFYRLTAELDTWDRVPGVNIIDFKEQFTEAGRRRIFNIIGVEWDPTFDHWGIGHNFQGGDSSLALPPFCDWWNQDLSDIFWNNWEAYRERQLLRTSKALQFHGLI